MICRGCSHGEFTTFCDLGTQPLANSLLREDQLDQAEAVYPLKPAVCERCQLVQLAELASPEALFSAYPYFSSQSATFVEHARHYAAELLVRFGAKDAPLVVEIASNDGYMLQHFMEAGVRCYGVEPARNVAEHAIKRGIPTLIEFFSAQLVCDLLVDSDADKRITGGKADLIVANNVLAHVPALQGFLQGIRLLLAPEGVFSVEVPWLKSLVDGDEAGTIYHEHFSYFLLKSLEWALDGSVIPLRVFDIQFFDVHGGTMRAYICHRDAGHAESPRVRAWRTAEGEWLQHDPLHHFDNHPAALKRSVWAFLLEQYAEGRVVVGYGAAAKASTVLSYCGVGPDVLPYIADTTPAKQGLYLGRIPIVSPGRLSTDTPEVIFVLAPNWIDEIRSKLRKQCSWRPTLAYQKGTEIVQEP